MEDAVLGSDGVEVNLSAIVPPAVPSPEDVAWADSCLANDLEISGDGWDSWTSFSNALNEVTSSRGGNLSTARFGDISSLSQDLSTSKLLDATLDDIIMHNEETDEHGKYQLGDENTDLPGTRFNLKNVFRPTYSEDLKDGGSSDSEESKGLPLWEEEESLENIFKVWNLETPSEEDEFIKQLNKAFSASSLDLSSPKGLANESIDDVISGMADLSLSRVT